MLELIAPPISRAYRKHHALDALMFVRLARACQARNDAIGAAVMLRLAINYLRIAKQ